MAHAPRSESGSRSLLPAQRPRSQWDLVVKPRVSLAYAGDEPVPTATAPALPERIGDGLNPLTMR